MSTKFPLFGLNMAGDRQGAQPEERADVQRGVSERLHVGYQASVYAEEALFRQLDPKPSNSYNSAEKLFQPKWVPDGITENTVKLPPQAEPEAQTVNQAAPVLDSSTPLENMPASSERQRSGEEEMNRQEHIDRIQAELAKIREEQQ